LSVDDPPDRFGIISAIGSTADHAVCLAAFRARLTRRFNVLGGLAGTPLEDEEDPSYFGFHIGVQEDLIVRDNSRGYVGAHYTAYMPSTTGDWDGETVNALGLSTGYSQSLPFSFLFRMRLFLEASWVITGEGTWRLPASGGNPAREQTDDFTGSQVLFGGEIVF
jgi:hypothetical protein